MTDLIGFGLIIPIIPKLSQDFNIIGPKLGLLLAAYPLAQFFAAPYLGSLSDKYGRRPVLLISKLGTVIAYLIFAYAQAYWLILLSRFIDGFTGGNLPVARAYMSDITTDRNRPRGMALIGAAYGLGFIIGPVVGGFMFGISGGKTLPALTGASLCFLSFIFTWLFLKESPSHHLVSAPVSFNPITNYKQVTNFPAVKRMITIQFLFMTCLYALQSVLPIFAANRYHLTPQTIGFLMVYIGLINIVIQLMIVKFSSRNLSRSVKMGLLFTGLGIFLITLVPSYWFIFPMAIVISLGIGFLNAYYPSLLLSVSGSMIKGEVTGVYESITSITQVIGPAIAGSLVVHFPYSVCYSTALIITLSAFLIDYQFHS